MYSRCILSDLVTYCQKENVPFTTFQNFSEILDILKHIVSGETSVEAVAAGNGNNRKHDDSRNHS